jgi:S1-C subfamily serine protease
MYAETQPELTTTPPPPRKPRLRRLATLAAAGGLVVATATGVGYAAGTRGPVTSSPATAQPGLASQSDGYGWSSGSPDSGQSGGYDDQSSPFGGDQSFGDQSQQGGSADGSQSSDSTSQASESELTGLTRVVSTNSYTGSVGVGTGMVLTSGGEVVTNHHVVEGANSIKVTVMSTGETYTARVVGTDSADDVAVLDLEDASGLDTVATDTDGVTVGDAVTAVGDGNGTEEYLSAATGSVTATDQPVTTQAEGTASGESLTGMIEISSDVVPGYSGGATYDADGEVVGMTTAATSNTDDPDGYAIPISKVLQVAGDLTDGVTNADYVYGQPAFLGIGLGSGTAVQGAYDGTPAADAGIGAGDQITSVGDIAVDTATQLRAAIASHSPGDDVSVTWTDSSGSSHTETITLANGPVA